MGSAADYVSDDLDRDKALDNLKNTLYGVAEFSADGESFVITDKAKYFENAYRAYVKRLEELSQISFDQFTGTDKSGDLSQKHYSMEIAYNDRYDHYMDDNGEDSGNRTLMQFLRDTENGEKWYIGGVIRYHY